MAEPLSALGDRYAQPDQAALVAQQWMALQAAQQWMALQAAQQAQREQQPGYKPVPTGLWDAISNVGKGLARDIPRAANWFVEQAKKSPAEAQQDVRDVAHGILAIPQKAFEEVQQHPFNSGEYNPAPILDAALLPMGISAPFAEAGAAGVFGGRLAKTANLDKLATAEKMATEGAPREAIRDATGWMKDVDNHWKFEIPDTASKFTPAETPGRLERAQQYMDENYPGQRLGSGKNISETTAALGWADRNPAQTPLKDILQHDPLYEAYPQLADIPTERQAGTALKGSWDGDTLRYGGARRIGLADPAIDASDAHKTVLHETQHAIQGIEGFATGGNTFALRPNTPAWDIYQERLAAMRKPLDKETYSKVSGYGDEIVSDKDYQQYLKIIRNPGPAADRAAQEYGVENYYRRLAGEVEARNVSKRLDPEQAKLPPWETQDVLDENKFVKFRNPGEPELQASRAPLDLSTEARLARAAAQGFDTSTPLYHGTSKDFDFKTFKDSRHGTWTTTNPNEASGYAIQNDSKSFKLAPGGGYNLVPVNSASRVLPLYGKPLENPYRISEGGVPDSVINATNYKKAQSDWFDQLKREGHDGVDYGSGIRIDFNNANLRSQFAPFDPAKADKGVIFGANKTDERGAAIAAAAATGRERDPRLWSPISDQKLSKPLDEMEHRYTDVRVPVPKFVDPADMVGGHAIYVPYDLSAANRTLTHVDGEKLARAVRAYGGSGFAEANPGMAAASETPIARKLDNQAAALTEKTGRPVFIMPMTMKPSAIDASSHVADPVSQLVQTAKITPKDAKLFDDMMRASEPVKKSGQPWVGIQDKGFQDYIANLQGGMKIKSLMADRMALAEWQKKGFPDIAAVRHAMTDPGLIDVPRNTTGMAISRYIPGKGLVDTVHPDYSKGVAGEHLGQWPYLTPFDTAAPTIAEGLARRNAENLAAGKKTMIQPRYHMEKPTQGVPTSQELDAQWLDGIMKQWNERKR